MDFSDYLETGETNKKDETNIIRKLTRRIKMTRHEKCRNYMLKANVLGENKLKFKMMDNDEVCLCDLSECDEFDLSTIPSFVNSIGDRPVFEKCFNLIGRLPDNIEIIRREAFRACYPEDGELALPRSVKKILGNMCSNTYFPLLELSDLPNLEYLDDRALEMAAISGTFTMGKHLKYLGDFALNGASVKSVQIQSNIKSIPNSCFKESTIKHIGFHTGSILEISEHAFKSTPIKNIKLPNKLETIEMGAFSECKLLEEVTIPNSLKHIHEKAFIGCNGTVFIVHPGLDKDIRNQIESIAEDIMGRVINL